MTLTPGNPVVGGTTLVRAAINSPNYVLNVTGWAIRQDGTAQFTGLVLIGGTFTGINFIINSSGSFFYSGTPAAGNLITSDTSQAGTDQFGNVTAQGTTTYDLVDFGAASLQGDGIAFFAPRASQAAALVQNGFIANLSLAGTEVLEIQATNGIILEAPRVITGTSAPATAALAEVQGDLGLTGIATPASPPAGNALLFADTSGFLRMLAGLSGDTTAYHIGHQELFSTSDQPITSTAFATVCGSASVGAGTYRVRAVLTVTQGGTAVADNFRLGFTGTISQVRVAARFTENSTTGETVFAATTTSNNGLLASTAYAAGAVYTAEFDGIISTSSGGTLSIQAAESVAGDSFTVLALSFFELAPAN